MIYNLVHNEANFIITTSRSHDRKHLNIKPSFQDSSEPRN